MPDSIKWKARLDLQDSKIDQVLSAVHRVQAIAEEQRSENRIMYEVLKGFNSRLDRVEIRQDNTDALVKQLAQSKKLN